MRLVIFMNVNHIFRIYTFDRSLFYLMHNSFLFLLGGLTQDHKVVEVVIFLRGNLHLITMCYYLLITFSA